MRIVLDLGKREEFWPPRKSHAKSRHFRLKYAFNCDIATYIVHNDCVRQCLTTRIACASMRARGSVSVQAASLPSDGRVQAGTLLAGGPAAYPLGRDLGEKYLQAAPRIIFRFQRSRAIVSGIPQAPVPIFNRHSNPRDEGERLIASVFCVRQTL